MSRSVARGSHNDCRVGRRRDGKNSKSAQQERRGDTCVAERGRIAAAYCAWAGEQVLQGMSNRQKQNQCVRNRC